MKYLLLSVILFIMLMTVLSGMLKSASEVIQVLFPAKQEQPVIEYRSLIKEA